MITIWIILMLLGVIGWLIYLFNTLVSLSNHADAAWAEIDAQLKRRYDLIGTLIKLVSANGIVATEQLAAACAAGSDAYTPSEKSRTEPPLLTATQTVLDAAAAKLNANEEFAQLRHTLLDIEDYLRDARRQYNAIAQLLNEQADAFPNNYAASLFGIQTREFFLVDGDKPARP
jgi:LemA protein